MKNRGWFCIATTLCLLYGALTSWAQTDRANKPIGPAAPLYTDYSSSKPLPPPSEEINVPDTRPLSGAQQLTLGSSEGSLNVLVPSFRFSQLFDSNSTLSTVSPGYEGVSSFSGSLKLRRSSETRELSLDYTGGGVFYSDRTNLNSSFHQFGVSQSISFRRWTLLLSDAFAYSPESPLGSAIGGFVPLGDIGRLGSLAGLNPSLTPSQNIFTDHTSRITNAAVGQIQYNLSARSSWTATAAYGILRFSDAALYNGDQFNFTTGYNRTLNAKDTVALTYTFGRFSFDSSNSDFNTHSAQLAYARRITGRLTAQLAAGPQITVMHNTQPGSENRVSWYGRGNLQYRRPKTEFNLGVTHGVNGGSGVLLGAESTAVQLGISRTLSRAWSTGITVQYARSKDLLAVARDFNSGSAGVELRRSVGRYAGVYLSYTFQRQDAPFACTSLACSGNVLRHVIGFGFDWRFRPIRLER